MSAHIQQFKNSSFLLFILCLPRSFSAVINRLRDLYMES